MASQDIEDYNRATELERLGGELLTIPPVKGKLLIPTGYSTQNQFSNVIPLEIAKLTTGA